MIRVSDSSDEEAEVSVQAFIHPDVGSEAKCLGFMSSFYGNPEYKGTCVIPPYGNGLFLNDTQEKDNIDSQVWTVRPIDDAVGTFALIASNKPAVCLRYLGVKDCSMQAELVQKDAEESTDYVAWKLVRRYDLAPVVSPPPPPAPAPLSPPVSPPTPPSPQTSPMSIPGPTISAPSSTSSGYVNVVVNALGGNAGCSVSSIVITAMASSVGSLAETVEVSASRPGLSSEGVSVPLKYAGYNFIDAVGKCSNGDVTERSNGLSVFYSGGPAPRVAESVLFSLKYIGSNIAFDSFDPDDEKRVCANINTVQPGGKCSILSVLPGSAVVTGTVTYPSAQEASSLVQQLTTVPPPYTLKEGPWSFGSVTDVETLAAESDPAPPTPRVPDPPTGVTMTPYNDDCPVGGLDVSFTPPVDRTGILGYTVTCKGPYITAPAARRALLATAPLAATVVTIGSSTNSARVTPLSPQANYVCDVQSLTVDQKSTVATSASSVMTGCTPPVFKILGVNQGGMLFYNPDINSPTAGSSWVALGTQYRTDACSLSGTNGAAIFVGTNKVYSSDNPGVSASWIATDQTGTSVSIGDNKQALFQGTGSNIFYTNDLVAANVVTTSGSGSGLQMSLSGTRAVGAGTSSVQYMSDVTTASFDGTISLPAGVTNPVSWVSLSGNAAVVAKGSSLYYTEDVTVQSIAWVTVTPMPTDAEFSGDIISAGLSGYQIIFTVDNGKYLSGNNIFLAPDIRNPVWSHPNGHLDCISMSS